MASIGKSVRAAIDEWERGEFELAMLHACNAVDGTASKLYPPQTGSNARFTGLLRKNYEILGPMGLPGVNLVDTRWPVKVDRPKASGGLPDIADVIYGVHRCTHGHGGELPDGFDLWPDAAGPDKLTRFSVERGKLQLSDRVIFGLLAVAILSPANVGQNVPDGYHLTFAGTVLRINEWWGRSEDFIDLARSQLLPSVELDFSNWR
jgi:hypothetical protein